MSSEAFRIAIAHEKQMRKQMQCQLKSEIRALKSEIRALESETHMFERKINYLKQRVCTGLSGDR